jgi:hypothetical protein
MLRTLEVSANIDKNIIAFCSSALITLAASIIKYFLEPCAKGDKIVRPRTSTDQNTEHWYFEERKTLETSISPKWINVLNKLILGLSDQQLASSLALLITAFAHHCTISNYHLNIVQDYAWFSCITHLSSVIALRGYWKEESRRRAFCTRLVLMFSMLVLLITAMIWGPEYDPPPGIAACPAQCTYEYASAAEMIAEVGLTTTTLSAAGIGQCVFLLLCYSMCFVFVVEWYRRFAIMVLLDVPGIVSTICNTRWRRYHTLVSLPGLNY